MEYTSSSTRCIDSRTFSNGTFVFNRGSGLYQHLFGRVCGFQSDGEASVVCDFELPDMLSQQHECGERFSQIYGREIKLRGINLREVSVPSQQLEIIPESVSEENGGKPYTLTYWEEGERGYSFGCLGISTNIGVLLRCMLDSIDSAELGLADTEEVEGSLRFLYEGKKHYCFREYELRRAPVYIAAKNTGKQG